ncbi:NmrA-like family protein [Annulohypoxylon maeteangense]|uniref:NmrA-like family protein n=1 Tax=Annulohypoxylon maeteangense TaxID=1927788 RepID=UPI0020086902|nr:NmrA-like family protein [Annulohypoxylon maeteangense]KAI0883288.1 NmrA-like family protein [Annulohypoxylon maeteangense]
MSYNRIAVYGHRGWAGSAIFNALVASGAPVKVIYRPGSDVSSVPSGVAKVELDIEKQQQELVAALQDIDIVISLVGHEGVLRQHAFVKALPRTNVKLFVPSDLGIRVNDEQGLRVPVNKTKQEVVDAAKKAGISTAVVQVGCFAESAFSIGIMGIDYTGNRMVFTGDSANQLVNICTRDYVAAAYASIFARTPPAELAGRVIGVSELKATGSEIAAALKKKYGVEPHIFKHSLEKVDNEIETCIKNGIPLSLAWWCRKTWGNGTLVKSIGEEIWEVEGYPKATLEELLVGDKLSPYRDLPPQIKQAFNSTIH